MSNGAERYLERPASEGIGRLRAEIDDVYRQRGPILEVLFAASGVARDVQHGLGAVPSGYVVLLELGGHVRASSITDWTTDLAFLQADAANTRARLFFVTTEVPLDA